MTEPEWNCSIYEEDANVLGLRENENLNSFLTKLSELQKRHDLLEERFQKLWFENHSIKELNVKLQDKIEELEGIIESTNL